ncbi:hypothetical protein B0I35DRAFT_415469 [Stachybotrys elegans]|uniref:Uncharacterized protein n=1 Tax=Stachybotrys elegans TaxID=80388 RepID=A0A8K0WK44_9HYPO|nr:hypothetical protein B0I35DRAFT_415469 [Stachybotrys elegans]
MEYMVEVWCKKVPESKEIYAIAYMDMIKNPDLDTPYTIDIYKDLDHEDVLTMDMQLGVAWLKCGDKIDPESAPPFDIMINATRASSARTSQGRVPDHNHGLQVNHHMPKHSATDKMWTPSNDTYAHYKMAGPAPSAARLPVMSEFMIVTDIKTGNVITCTPTADATINLHMTASVMNNPSDRMAAEL